MAASGVWLNKKILWLYLDVYFQFAFVDYSAGKSKLVSL